MNNKLLFLAAVVFAVAFSACGGMRQASFYKSPLFKPASTIKVVTLNTSDVLAGRLEHFLLTNGFRVISDNSFRLPGSTAFPNPVSPLDTSLYRPGQMVINIPYMEEKLSDYILRYQVEEAITSQGRSTLNIFVVNTDTGETEISYLIQQSDLFDSQRLDRVLREFVLRMKR